MTQEHESTALVLPDSGLVREQLNAVRAFQAVVKQTLVNGHDFGIIPGTPKPTLLKPGAEKIVKLLGLSDEYEVVNRMEDWEKGFFAYEVKAILRRQGVVVSSGLGECNSKESKYRWRWVWPRDIPDGISHDTLVKKEWTKEGKKYTQYRVENEDIYSQVNTILKMAKKRALVDAALSAGRLSDVFTQDIEEIQHEKQEAGEPAIEELFGPEGIQAKISSTPPTISQGSTKAPLTTPGPSGKAEPTGIEGRPSLLTPRQKEAVLAIARQHGWSLEVLNQELKQLNYPVLEKLTIAQASGFITWAGKEATKGGLI